MAGIIAFLVAQRPDSGNLHESAAATHELKHPQHTEQQLDADHNQHHHHGRFLALFHLFHPAHMLFSAAATTAMFWRYEKKLLKAIIVGLIGAIVVCGISDIAMPHVSAMILHKDVELHICIVQHPMLVLPFAAVGILLGLLAAVGVQASTFFSHSLHVFASTMASIFYLIGAWATPTGWIDDIGKVFIFVVLAVLIPCCTSDIVFPLLMVRPAQQARIREAHHH